MNRVLFSFMAFLILSLGSCQESSYEEDFQEFPSKTKFIDPSNQLTNGIVSKLKAYNDSLCINAGTLYSTKKTVSRQNKRVALADFFGFCEGASIGMTIGEAGGPLTSVIGGLIGGTLFGTYRSYLAASPSHGLQGSEYNNSISSFIRMKEEVTDYSVYYPECVSLRLPKGKQGLQIYGAQHNLALENLRKNRFSSTSLKDAFKNGTLTREEYTVLSSGEMQTLFQHINSSSQPHSFDLGETANAVIELYRQAIENSTNSYKDVETISNRYIAETYSTSDLTSSQKDNIMSSICVMTSSLEYWNIFN